MQNTARMAQLQAKGAGAPPEEPPMAPPMAGGAPEESMGGGMPPPEVAIPKIAELLAMLAESLPDEQKSVVSECASRLQGVFASDPATSGGMSPEDSEAYGEA
jgi:hypothetical protein